MLPRVLLGLVVEEVTQLAQFILPDVRWLPSVQDLHLHPLNESASRHVSRCLPLPTRSARERKGRDEPFSVVFLFHLLYALLREVPERSTKEVVKPGRRQGLFTNNTLTRIERSKVQLPQLAQQGFLLLVDHLVFVRQCGVCVCVYEGCP